jgi:hypothetical protein
MALSFRTSVVRPFTEVRDYDNGAGTTLQIGATTYRTLDDGDEAYQTSYIEFGGRSDHLDDAIAQLRGKETTVRRVSMASANDQRYVGTPSQNSLPVETVEIEATNA